MKKPNISVIILDTMRLDEFKRLEEKHNRFKELGFIFLDNCIAPASWTLPSHASLFTGKYPKEHGAHETTKVKSLDIDKIKLKIPTFIGELSKLGYKTYGISANPYVHPIYGFNEFDNFKEESYFTDVFGHTIEIPLELRPKIAIYRERYGNEVDKTAMAIAKEDPNLLLEAPSVFSATLQSAAKKLRAKFIDGWPIEKGGKNIVKTVAGTKFAEPFFMFINLMEAHDPYVGKKGQDFNWATPFLKKKPEKSTVDLWKRLYSKASLKAYLYAIQIISNVIDRYGDDQLIILTSDHGQALNEHGFIGHGTVLYDEVVKIPMAIKIPKGKRYGTPGKKGFSSLVNVRGFILSALEGNSNAFAQFDNKSVYSESFGMPANITMATGIDRAKLRAYDKPQKRKFPK